MPYTRVYKRPDQPLPDSQKMRIRLGSFAQGKLKHIHPVLPTRLRANAGLVIDSRYLVSMVYFFDSYFETAPIEDVL